MADKIKITQETGLANYKMVVRYDGRNYYGWQRHKDHPTIQGALENVITQCFGLRVNVEGSGRTDRGTHAQGQVATVHLPEDIGSDALLRLNHFLDKSIEIISFDRVPAQFHARESAVGKSYCYKIWNHPDLTSEKEGRVWYIPEKLNVDEMKKACTLFEGKMDFASFAKVPNFKRASTVRTVYSLDLEQDGPLLCFTIIGDGFLYKMVRNIIRLVVKVGEGRFQVKDIPGIIKAKNRKASPGTAPASGLYLEQVFYDSQSLDETVEKRKKGICDE